MTEPRPALTGRVLNAISSEELRLEADVLDLLAPFLPSIRSGEVAPVPPDGIAPDDHQIVAP